MIRIYPLAPGRNIIAPGADKIVSETVRDFTLDGSVGPLRVFNPAFDASGSRVTWHELCVRSGIDFGPGVQWHSIADRLRDSSQERFTPPMMGSLDTGIMTVLWQLLVKDFRQPVYGAYWNGYADLDLPETLQVTLPPSRQMSVFQIENLPQGSSDAKGATPVRNPMRWWPDDASWLVSNDIYARSVYVSGPRLLMDRVRLSPILETIECPPETVLSPEDM